MDWKASAGPSSLPTPVAIGKRCCPIERVMRKVVMETLPDLERGTSNMIEHDYDLLKARGGAGGGGTRSSFRQIGP